MKVWIVLVTTCEGPRIDSVHTNEQSARQRAHKQKEGFIDMYYVMGPYSIVKEVQ